MHVIPLLDITLQLDILKYSVTICSFWIILLFFRFRRKKKDDADYITIVNTRTGCWSSVGKTSGEQFLNLQSPGCLSTLGTPVHEFMHAIGFYHEQSRFDRDDYVTILWENIEMGMLFQQTNQTELSLDREDLPLPTSEMT